MTTSGKIERVGILTAGGDCPGLNAAVRAVGKAALSRGIEVVGVHDGFLGLIERRTAPLDKTTLAGILTVGGTILGTSRIKPHKFELNGKVQDVRELIAANCAEMGLDAVVCIGGGGTHKNALRLVETGLRIITLPKTIDNDIVLTDTTFGFNTALSIATEAIDRLHSTAHSHHRIVIAETMGHRAGWLALGAGIAAGADVILIPEIPYDIGRIADAIRYRSQRGTNFSIIAVAEGAMSMEDAVKFRAARARKKAAASEDAFKQAQMDIAALEHHHSGNTLRLAQQLENLTGLESRVTILGYVQRGGAPSAVDRLLATRLGTACADLIAAGQFGVMVAARGDGAQAVPLAEVAGKRREVPLDHPLLASARAVGTCLGQ